LGRAGRHEVLAGNAEEAMIVAEVDAVMGENRIGTLGSIPTFAWPNPAPG
jgi:hypothetical protein